MASTGKQRQRRWRWDQPTFAAIPERTRSQQHGGPLRPGRQRIHPAHPVLLKLAQILRGMQLERHSLPWREEGRSVCRGVAKGAKTQRIFAACCRGAWRGGGTPLRPFADPIVIAEVKTTKIRRALHPIVCGSKIQIQPLHHGVVWQEGGSKREGKGGRKGWAQGWPHRGGNQGDANHPG